MSMQRKRSILLIKDKQTIIVCLYPLSISHLEKGRKGTNLGCTQFKINLAPDIRYMQKQREDPEIH